MPKQIEINNMDSEFLTKTTPTPVPFHVFKQTIFWPGRENLRLELKMKD